MEEFKRGDIVQIEGKEGKYVYLWNNTPYNPGACSYDDDLEFMSLENMCEKKVFYEFDIDIITIHVTGISMTPKITKVEGEIPFAITKETRYNVRRKEPKHITVYE
jgi:hypothetical protein